MRNIKLLSPSFPSRELNPISTTPGQWGCISKKLFSLIALVIGQPDVKLNGASSSGFFSK